MRQPSIALLSQARSPQMRAAADAACAVRDDAAARESAALDYRIVSTRSAFDALAADWEALFVRAGSGAQYFQSFAWCRHWCDHYLGAGGSTLAVVTGRREGRLVLVWPLVVTRMPGLVKLSSLGAPVSQYSDAVIEASPHAVAHLRGAWDSLVSAAKPDLVRLAHVREDAAIAPLMSELGAMATQRLEAPYIDLAAAGGFEGFMRRHSSHSRKKYRAAARRLESVAEVRFVEEDHGRSARTLASMTIDMKHRQLLERGLLSPAFAEARFKEFFADVAEEANPPGARVHALDCSGTYAAANIVLRCKDRVLGHVFGYNSRFAKDSVGALLLHQTFKRAMEDGYRTFDLLAPADAYKLRYADGTVGVIDWAVPVSARGRVFTHLYLRLVRPLAKMGLHVLPARVRRRLAQLYYRRAS